MKYEMKSLSFGQLFGTGFSLYLDNIVPLLSMSFLCNLVYFLQRHIENSTGGGFLLLLLTIFLNVFTGALLTAFYADLISRKYLGEKTSVVYSIGHVFPIILPLIGLNIIVSIATGIASILFIIPGIIVFIMYSLSSTIKVIERLEVGDCMSRSGELIKGYKWQAFGILALTTLIGIILGGLAGAFAPENHIAIYIVTSITSPILPCMLILIYYKMRIDKEGFALEHLARQFSFDESAGQNSKV